MSESSFTIRFFGSRSWRRSELGFGLFGPECINQADEKKTQGPVGLFRLRMWALIRFSTRQSFSSSFVCGGLCGSGYRYVLQKQSRRCVVLNKLMVWVSYLKSDTQGLDYKLTGKVPSNCQ